MAQPQLKRTKEYSRFKFIRGNRSVELNAGKRNSLRKAMEKYGFLPSHPIMVRKNGGAQYEIVDGQHRLAAAKELGIDVYYVIDETDVDVAFLNSTAKPWTVGDYISRWCAEGISDYREIVSFSENEEIPLPQAAALLDGVLQYGTVQRKVEAGDFKVRNREEAHRIAKIRRELINVNDRGRRASVMYALRLCMRLDNFDVKRFLRNAKKRPELLDMCGDQEQTLNTFEKIYNHGARQAQRIPLAFDASQVNAK